MRERDSQYMNEDMKNDVNKIKNDESTTGRDQDVHTYLDIKSMVGHQWEPMRRERGDLVFL